MFVFGVPDFLCMCHVHVRLHEAVWPQVMQTVGGM